MGHGRNGGAARPRRCWPSRADRGATRSASTARTRHAARWDVTPYGRRSCPEAVRGADAPALHADRGCGPAAAGVRVRAVDAGLVRELIRREFKVSLSAVSAGGLLRTLGLSPQRPLWRAWQGRPRRRPTLERRGVPGHPQAGQGRGGHGLLHRRGRDPLGLPRRHSCVDANSVLICLRELEDSADARTMFSPRFGTSRSVVAEECHGPTGRHDHLGDRGVVGMGEIVTVS